MKARGFGQTHTGQRREHNEDVYAMDDALGLYVVADGMGGHNAGEVAARVAVDVVVETLAGDPRLRSPSRRRRLSTRTLAARLRDAIGEANRAVWEASNQDLACAGMGCTLSAAWLVDDRAIVGHVGDSRVYHWHHATLGQVTTDHTLAQLMVTCGILSPTEAHQSRNSATLTQAIGTEESVEIDVVKVDLEAGDRLLICSDGLSDYAGTDAVLERELAAFDAGDIPGALVAYANACGGKDNITAVVIEVDDVPVWMRQTGPMPAISGSR